MYTCIQQYLVYSTTPYLPHTYLILTPYLPYTYPIPSPYLPPQDVISLLEKRVKSRFSHRQIYMLNDGVNLHTYNDIFCHMISLPAQFEGKPAIIKTWNSNITVIRRDDLIEYDYVIYCYNIIECDYVIEYGDILLTSI